MQVFTKKNLIVVSFLCLSFLTNKIFSKKFKKSSSSQKVKVDNKNNNKENNFSGVANFANVGASSDIVLLSIKGKPALTEEDFSKFVEEVAASDQQIFFMLQLDPVKTTQNLFDAKVRSIVIGEWAKKTGVRKKAEYIKQEQELLDRVRVMLDNQEFVQQKKIDISEKELKSYYDSHKTEDQRFLVAPERLKVELVGFGKKTGEAKLFKQDLLSNKNISISGLAEKIGLKVKSIDTLTDQATDYMLVQSAKESFGSNKKNNSSKKIKIIKSEDNFFVANLVSKEEAKYRDFNDVKDMIKELLMPEKIKSMFDSEMPKLAKKYKISENKDYFVKLKKQIEDAQAEQTKEILANKDLLKNIKK